jgi:hypothetical protein
MTNATIALTLLAEKGADVDVLRQMVQWWSWGDLNPRPQAFFEQFYMCSRLI